MKSTLYLCALATLSLGHLSAQEERRQAVITGAPGSPKCTIEVEVDVVADVEIHGTEARLHTLGGSPATWRRFVCNQPMPLHPANFRFRGIDGRGRQTLIGDPLNTGMAVVRIEDPKSGREGYTFDLQWDGAAGPMPGGPGYPNQQPGYPQQSLPGQPPSGDRGDRDHDRDGDRGRGGRFEADDAIHQCGDAAEGQLRRNGYRETRVIEAKMDGDAGRGDWIYGKLIGRRGPNTETFGFACSVDFDARRIGAVNVRPANDGYYGGDADHNRFSKERAIRACREAVQDRLRHDGYTDFDVRKMDVDDRPGNNDWIVGGLAARRGGFSDNFEFSCSVDFDAGRIRSINVNRR
jgi:hypothetical protein